MARDFWLRLFGSRSNSPQTAGNVGYRHQCSNRPVRTPSPLPRRVETAEKVACDALQADRARMRWLELEVARLSSLAAEPSEEMQATLQEQKQDYVQRLLRFQAEAQASKEQAEQLRQEVGRLRGKVHQRGFEVLAQQQLLQVAQQQLAQQEAQVADAKSACAGLAVRVEALCVKAVAAANMLDGAMKQPAGTANVQLGAGISKCMEVLQGLMQLPDTMAALTKAAAAAEAPMPATDSQKRQQQQQEELSSAAKLAARLWQQQQQQALWSPSPADKQQLPSSLWVTDGTPRCASCPTNNPSPHPPGAAAAAAAAAGMFADAGRQQPKASGNAGSNSRLQSRSVSPEFWRIAQGTELMGGAGNLPRPQSHTGVTTRSDGPTLSTRTRGSRRYSSDDGSDRGSNGGGGYRGSNGGGGYRGSNGGGYRGSNGGGYRGSNGSYPGSNGCHPAAHSSIYPTSHASSGRLPQMPVPLARLKARRLSDRAAAAAAVAAANRGPRAYSSSGPDAAAAVGVGGAYGSKFSSTVGQQGDEEESVWLTPRFPQLAVASEREHKAFADEQRCDGRQQATAGEGTWAIPARCQPAVQAEQQARDIFRRQYQKQEQQQQQQQQEQQRNCEPFGAGFAGGYEERELHAQQRMQQQQQQQRMQQQQMQKEHEQQQQGAGEEAWGRGHGSAEARHGAVQPAQVQAYWRSMAEAQQYSSRAGPGGRACDSSSHMSPAAFSHSQGNKPQERPDMQQHQHHQQQGGGIMNYIGAVPGSSHQHQEQQQHPQQQQQQNHQQQPTYQQQQQQQQQQQRYRSLNSADRFGSGSLAQDKQLQYQQQQAQQEAREQEQSELWLQQKQHQLRQLQQMRALVEERVGNMHLHLADEQFQKHTHEEQ